MLKIMVLCMNSIIYFCFLFSNAISVTQMQLHVIPSHFASVVTESGMAEEVKMVKKKTHGSKGG